MSGRVPTNDFENRVKAYIARQGLLAEKGAVVVGVSGGADSVTLLDLLSRSTSDLHVVHVNYGLRGDDSDDDERLVRDLCLQRDLSLVVHRVDPSWHREAASRSLQEAARDLRYDIMLDVARSAGARTVAVGHNLDDQAETFLLRLIRGTGPLGLAAMAPRRELGDGTGIMLVRPLLFASRTEIEAYAVARNLSYRDDSSNRDDRFDRVRIRNQVLPAITAAFGDASIQHIASAAGRQREVLESCVNPILDADLDDCIEVRRSSVHLRLEKLASLESGRRRLVLLRAIQRYLPNVPRRSSVIERTEALMAMAPGKRLQYAGGTIWRARESIALVGDDALGPFGASRIEPNGENETPFGSITLAQIDVADVNLSGDANTEVVDGSVLDHPLSLGPWRPGERFRPIGSPGTKKVSDFLTDKKVPTYARHSVPVLRSGEEIVWIPGHRLADRFRLTAASTTAVQITFESAV